MKKPYRPLGAVVGLLIFALACGGGPTGPSSGAGGGSAGTVVVNGQAFQTTANGSGGFRRPPLAGQWPNGLLDITLGSCSPTAPSIAISVPQGNPAPGGYPVSRDMLESVQANFREGSGRTLHAGWSQLGSSGSVTISSISPTRVSGSYEFVMESGTTRVEGTFDVVIDQNRVICG